MKNWNKNWINLIFFFFLKQIESLVMLRKTKPHSEETTSNVWTSNWTSDQKLPSTLTSSQSSLSDLNTVSWPIQSSRETLTHSENWTSPMDSNSTRQQRLPSQPVSTPPTSQRTTALSDSCLHLPHKKTQYNTIQKERVFLFLNRIYLFLWSQIFFYCVFFFYILLLFLRISIFLKLIEKKIE